jgi:hypothetical protein
MGFLKPRGVGACCCLGGFERSRDAKPWSEASHRNCTGQRRDRKERGRKEGRKEEGSEGHASAQRCRQFIQRLKHRVRLEASQGVRTADTACEYLWLWEASRVLGLTNDGVNNMMLVA